MKTHTELSPVLAEWIEAANKPDPDAFADCFAEDAVVTDEGQTRQGKEAIKKWSLENHFAYHVTLEPAEAREENGVTVVTCELDGDYDKTGLPDPLFLDFKFRVKNNKIVSLEIE